MLKPLQEDRKYVEITGFKNVQVKDAEKLLTAVRKEMPADAEVQLFDADLVASWQHLYFAVLNSLMAFRTKRKVQRIGRAFAVSDLELETVASEGDAADALVACVVERVALLSTQL